MGMMSPTMTGRLKSAKFRQFMATDNWNRLVGLNEAIIRHTCEGQSS